jgi:PTH1 family peptidyl-tRNA hydrolase
MKTKLIVWLGNPGAEYVNTRHNVGFKVLDLIQEYVEGTKFLFDKKFNAEVSIAKDGKYMIIMAKPQTYMNLSGEAVAKLLNYYKIDPKNLLVIHDEIDLEPGHIKLKWNWWHNGHNGLKNIDKMIWTNKYWRLKIWVWRPEHKYQVVNYVLWKLPDSVWEYIEKNKDLIFEYVRQFLVAN